MTREEFENIKEFAGRLPELRHQVADGQLLDRCEHALNDLIEHASLNFEDFPHQEATEPSPPHYVEPPRAEPEPEPPLPPSSEPEPEVRHHATPHKVAQKRPTPRKTHR